MLFLYDYLLDHLLLNRNIQTKVESLVDEPETSLRLVLLALAQRHLRPHE